MAHKKKTHQKSHKPKIDLMAGLPRPKPINLHGSTQNLELARDFPILGCWVMEDWQDHGLTPVIVARSQPDDRVTYGTFVVDIYCLGVKNASWEADISSKKFERDLPQLCSGAPLAVEASLAHEMIYGAIEYAHQWGFEPHRDFAKARLVLDPPTNINQHRIEFGYNGKPFFCVRTI